MRPGAGLESGVRGDDGELAWSGHSTRRHLQAEQDERQEAQDDEEDCRTSL